jgi:hypothetical protein
MASPNTEPIFKKYPFLAVATVSTQVVPRNGTSNAQNAYLLAQASETGAIIESIKIVPTPINGTVPAVTVRFFKKGSNGTNLVMCLPEVQVNAISVVNDSTALPSITVPLNDSIQGVLGTKALLLGSGDSFYVALSQSIAPASFNVVCQGGFY